MDIEAIDKALAKAGIEVVSFLKEGEFTLPMFARAKGISTHVAKRIITNALEAGVFECVGMRYVPRVRTGAQEAYRCVNT